MFTHGDAEEEETRHFSSAKRKSGNQTMEILNKFHHICFQESFEDSTGDIL